MFSSRFFRARAFSLAMLIISVLGCRAQQPVAPSGPPPSPFRLIAGTVVDDDEGGFVLETSNAKIESGSPLLVIDLSEPQHVLPATIQGAYKGEAPSPTMIEEGTTPHRYKLNLSGDVLDAGAMGIGILGDDWQVTEQQGLVGIDLDRDGELEFFRECASREGIHFGIRSGTPVVGPLKWHAYTYVGMDVEPTCGDDELVIATEGPSQPADEAPSSEPPPQQ